MGCRRSWRPGWRSASSAAASLVLVAGCGGSGPAKLARVDATPLIALATRITRETSCGQARDIPRLSTRVIALVNAHRVPADLQEPLLSGVNDLASHAPSCRRPDSRVAVTEPTIDTSTVASVPHGTSPTQQAANVLAWLVAWSS